MVDDQIRSIDTDYLGGDLDDYLTRDLLRHQVSRRPAEHRVEHRTTDRDQGSPVRCRRPTRNRRWTVTVVDVWGDEGTTSTNLRWR